MCSGEVTNQPFILLFIAPQAGAPKSENNTAKTTTQLSLLLHPNAEAGKCACETVGFSSKWQHYNAAVLTPPKNPTNLSLDQ